ncbi:HIT-type domain-containing protein [Madurella fahalii]|uniref:HIT-type domain-containing protein n=1 Tax=Madurella fahalii TaxID=1157608 RepID=A0ABQ0G6F1_9PEZI
MSLASQNGGSGSGAGSDIPASQPTMLGPVSPEPSAAAPATDPPADVDTEPSFSPRKMPEPKICGVCGTQPGKYKCPRCSMPYCSVPCNKQHKENHPPDQPKPQPPPTAQKATEPSNNDPYAILLDHRQTFARLFEKYPSLPAELIRIQQTTLPPSSDNNSSSGFPIPGINSSNNSYKSKQVPWTRDVGLRKGAAALRKARTDPSETGDGVREFCELVLFLLSKQKEGGAEVVGKVREEVAAEDMEVIERLLREEGG